jgi:hypothetical protein
MEKPCNKVALLGVASGSTPKRGSFLFGGLEKHLSTS